MLLDLSDNKYITEKKKYMKQSVVFPHDYSHLSSIETTIEEWRLSKLEHFYEDAVYRCDHCGVVLNCINTPYNYSIAKNIESMMGILCDKCEGGTLGNQSPISQQLNRIFIEERFSEEFLIRLRNIDNSVESEI